MNSDPQAFLGAFALATSTLLAATLAALRIRELLRETPDPKLTYTTHAEHDKLRQLLCSHQHDTKRDLQLLRAETRADYTELERRRSHSTDTAHHLIRKNAEHIAALIAENNITRQRLSELTLKTDKLLERLHT